MGQALSVVVPLIALAGTVWLASGRPTKRLCPPHLRPRVRYTRIRAPDDDCPETPCKITIETPPRRTSPRKTTTPDIAIVDVGDAIAADEDPGTVTGFVTSTRTSSTLPDTTFEARSWSPVREPPQLDEYADLAPYEWDHEWDDWTTVCGADHHANVLASKLSNFDSYYHIGFVGAQGSGKTSLCSVMRAAIEHARVVGGKVSLDEATLERIVAKASETNDDIAAEDDDRDATPHVIGNLVLWDLGGAGTARIPAAECIQRSGLAFLSSVVLVVGLHDTEATAEMVWAMHKLHVPFVMVQTHMDEYIRNTHTRESITLGTGRLKYNRKDVDFLLQVRRDYLRERYALEDRDQVMCVNTLPWIFEAKTMADVFAKDTYDLADCVLYTLRAAEAAHPP